MATTIGLGLANPVQCETLKKTLLTNGYHVIFTASEGNELLRKARAGKPEIVLLDFHLPNHPGYDIANILYQDAISHPILLLNENQKSILSRDPLHYEFVTLLKPFKVGILLNTLEVVAKSSQRIKSLTNEIQTLKENLENRKFIERAKNILIKKFQLTEEEAHKKIQKQSMDRRVSMKEIAQALITLYEE